MGPSHKSPEHWYRPDTLKMFSTENDRLHLKVLDFENVHREPSLSAAKNPTSLWEQLGDKLIETAKKGISNSLPKSCLVAVTNMNLKKKIENNNNSVFYMCYLLCFNIDWFLFVDRRMEYSRTT